MGFFGKIKSGFKSLQNKSKQASLDRLAKSKANRKKMTDRFKWLDRLDKFEKHMKYKERKLKKKFKNFFKKKKTKSAKETKPSNIFTQKKKDIDFKKVVGKNKSKYSGGGGSISDISKHNAHVAKNLNPSHESRDHWISKIVDKADFISTVKEDVREMLAGQSSAIVNIDEFVKDITLNRNRMGFYSNDELEKFDDMMNKILDELGFDITDFDVSKVNEEIRENKDEYYEMIKKISFNTYMDNWKTRFFGSDEIISDGVTLDDEGRANLWKQIEESKSQVWFDEYKARKLNE